MKIVLVFPAEDSTKEIVVVEACSIYPKWFTACCV